MNKKITEILIVLFVIFAIAGAVLTAAGQPAAASAIGELSGIIDCSPGDIAITTTGTRGIVQWACVSPATVTPEPTATATIPAPTSTATIPAPTVTPTMTACLPLSGANRNTDHERMHWHPPVGDCVYEHEHGAAAPQWVEDAGYMPMFTHDGGTPGENVAFYKHTGFKGFSVVYRPGQANEVEIYAIIHLDTNPGGHMSRFHSYQIWARDASGGVSHWSGWLDFGTNDNTSGQIQTTCQNSNLRPIILVNDEGCPIQFETWYSRAGGSGSWSWDFGFSISPNYYAGGDPVNFDTWEPIFDYANNATRRMEAAFYLSRVNPGLIGTPFWSTQFGEIVSGPSDPVCGTIRTVGAKQYTVACIEQYIAATMTSVVFPGNAWQETYPDDGVLPPN